MEQQLADAGVGRGCLGYGAAQRVRDVAGEHGLAGLGVLDQVGTEQMRTEQIRKVAIGGGELDALGCAGLDLPLRAHQALGCGRTQRLHVAVEGRWDLGHASRERRPVRLCLGGHQVEDVADRLKWGGQDVEAHLVEPGGVGLLGQAETLGHR